ncbi:MAG: carboxylating nicotinate-nucleotide diphosphorylase [bacterium]|nr:carboxylating nicotinate-nucleotide diphosphorylase [bacterium]
MMEWDRFLAEALSEDLPNSVDITTDSFISPDTFGVGWIEAREDAVVSGLGATAAIFHLLDADLTFTALVRDGDRVGSMDRIADIRGQARTILRGERTALNLLCHLSGIATMTQVFVAATKEWGTKILATRKTLPGLRSLEIAAVRHGGGDVYRTNLSDSILLKDNHLAIMGGMPGVRAVLDELRKQDSTAVTRVLRDGKIEAGSPDEVADAIAMGWRHVLLDNFAPADVRNVVESWREQAFFEASGGITLSNVREYAATGVHAISIGAITHSARAIDFSVEVEWRRT